MAYHIYKNGSAYTLVILLFVTTAAYGCDKYKGERASLNTQITGIETDLTRLKEERARVAKEVETLASEIKQQSESLQEHLKRRTKLQDDMALYILDHKTTTLVLMMTSASVSAILNESTDQKTKDSLRTAGVIGAVVAAWYCYYNAEECGSVTTKLLYFGSQIESESKSISGITAWLSRNKPSLQEREEKNSSLAAMIDRKVLERDTLRRKHDSLLCKFCF